MDNYLNGVLVGIPEDTANLQLPNPELRDYYRDEQDRVFWLNDNVENCAEDSVYYRIVRLADEGHFDEAENLMYDALNPLDKDEYYTMLAAYEYMNDFDDDFLENNNFSREEIEDGIAEITKKHDTEGLYTILVESQIQYFEGYKEIMDKKHFL